MSSFKTLQLATLVFLFCVGSLAAKIGREIREQYVAKYENRAIFLKVPVRGLRQVVHVDGTGAKLDRSNLGEPVNFKVGEQVRITEVSFKDDSIRFKIASIDLGREGELTFMLPAPIQYAFPQQGLFEQALSDSLTEGLSYKELDSAKGEFIRGQFEFLIREFSATSGTTPDFVRNTILEENPQYQAAKREAATAKSQLKTLRQQQQDGETAALEARRRLARLTRELEQAKSELASTRGQQKKAQTEGERYQRELGDLRQKNNEYERQISKLAQSLDIRAASNTKLDSRLKDLGGSIESLKRERTSISERAEKLTQELKQGEERNKRLTQDLKQARREKQKLSSDLRTLTSNKDSLEARFLETQKKKEGLETAAALTVALRLEKSIQEREGEAFEVGDLFLLSQKLGVFEVQVPDTTGKLSTVKFQMDSPDLVEFDDEERRLYKALGDPIRIETAWVSESEELKAVLVDGDAAHRNLKPREKVQWLWKIEGNLSAEERIVLTTHLTSRDGERVDLAPREFLVQPAGLLAPFRASFSLFSLLTGVVLGAAVFGLALSLRGRSQPKTEAVKREDYVIQKEL